MENWGAITFNESTLLFDPQISSEQTKRDIFVTVAHEMSHQWFRQPRHEMAWWDNLWLNEGFASWMDSKASDHFNPDWQMWLDASAERDRRDERADARNTTHPLQTPVASESEANDAFDSITYDKGRAFIRMLESYLGESEFRRGIPRIFGGPSFIPIPPRRDALGGVGKKPPANRSKNFRRLDGTTGPACGERQGGLRERPGGRLAGTGTADAGVRPRRAPVAMGPSIRRPDEHQRTRVTSATSCWRANQAQSPFRIARGAIKANAGDVGYYRVWVRTRAVPTVGWSTFNQLPVAKTGSIC